MIVIGACNSSKDSSTRTSHTIPMPSGLVKDELIVGMMAWSDSVWHGWSTSSSSSDSDWNITNYHSNTSGETLNTLRFFGRALGGGSDALIIDTDSLCIASYVIYRLSNISGWYITPQVNGYNLFSEGGSNFPTGPCPYVNDNTPGSFLYLSIAASDYMSSAASVPTNWTLGAYTNAASTSEAMIITAYRYLNNSQMAQTTWGTGPINVQFHTLMFRVLEGSYPLSESTGGIGMYLASGRIGMA